MVVVNMEYRSVSDLADRTRRLAWQLPKDVDLVAGIPRSGMLAATMVALWLDLPVTDVDSLIAGRIFRCGPRYSGHGAASTGHPPRKVVVVDDSVGCGSQLNAVRRDLTEAGLPFEILYAAAFVMPGSEKLVDYYGEVVPLPRAFEWNILHRPMTRNMCFDLDGVICRDPTPEENDDGERYKEFLRNAEPLFIPKYEVGWIVTCRLEKYRDLTVEWLQRHGVRYRHLVMMRYDSKAERQAAAAYSKYKAFVYLISGASLFVESSQRQAIDIAYLTGRPVFCTETWSMVQPTGETSKQDYNVKRRMLTRACFLLIDFSFCSVRRGARLARRIARKALAITTSGWERCKSVVRLHAVRKKTR
jgi:orotate phosphoribosyltransferase